MSKQHFEMIARTMRRAKPDFSDPSEFHDYWKGLVLMFADELASTNPRFDSKRFMAACMGQDSHDSAGRKVRYS